MTFRILPPEEWWKLKPLSEEVPDPDAAVFVLEDGDAVVAMRVVKQVVWAGGMVVHPDRRREGLATTLQWSVEDALRTVGVKQYFMCPVPGPAELTVASFGLIKLPLRVYTKEL